MSSCSHIPFPDLAVAWTDEVLLGVRHCSSVALGPVCAWVFLMLSHHFGFRAQRLGPCIWPSSFSTRESFSVPVSKWNLWHSVVLRLVRVFWMIVQWHFKGKSLNLFLHFVFIPSKFSVES